MLRNPQVEKAAELLKPQLESVRTGRTGRGNSMTTDPGRALICNNRVIERVFFVAKEKICP